MTEQPDFSPSSPTAYTDPSFNVLELVRAGERRLGDTLASETRRLDNLRSDADKHLRELINVRADANQRLIEANERLINVRADYETQLRIAAVKQAEALAGQLATVQETFRTMMDTRFAQVDRQMAEMRDAITTVVAAATGAKQQVVETRSAAGETRLTLGAVVGGLALLISLVALIVLLAQ